MTAGRSPVRRQIAVLLSRFPLITETFILREVIELERQGQPVLLVPMIRENPAVVHPEALPWVERALFTPWMSMSIAAANVRMFLRQPLVYLRTVGQLIAGMIRSPDFLFRTAALFPKSVYVAERLAAEDIRHVHAHYATHPATMAMIISRFVPGLTYSITAHAHDIFVNRTMLGPKLASAAGIRVISRFNRGYLAALFPQIPLQKIEVIRVGIEPENYRAPTPAVDAPFRILTVAGLKPYKGIRILIEACASLRRSGVAFVCDIVGDGPLRRTLAAQIQRAGLEEHVHLAGARPQGEVAEMIRLATVFVLPSIIAPDGQMEGIPVALMEAMAASRPVVASALSGVPELIEHGVTGLLVDPNNPEMLANAIRRIADDPEAAARLGEAGRERVAAEFALRENVSRLREWLDRMNPAADVSVAPLIPDHVDAGLREIHETRDSTVVRMILARGSSEPDDVVVKEHRSRDGQSAPPEIRAAREAQILRELFARASDHHGRRLTVPELLRIESAFVLMRAAPGVRLDALIRSDRLGDLVRLEEAIVDAASWLRWFHQSGDDGVRVHGDFWPGNVFISRDAVTVIDLEGVRPGNAVDDLAWFLVHLELFFPPPLGRRFRRLRAAFLRGYYGDEVPLREVVRAEAAVAGMVRRSLESKGLRGQLARFQLAHHRAGEAA